MVVGDTCVSWLSHTSNNTTFLSKATDYLSHNASEEVRGENMPERKVASTGDRTHNHQVMSPTCSPLSHPGRAQYYSHSKVFLYIVENIVGKLESGGYPHLFLIPQRFQMLSVSRSL